MHRVFGEFLDDCRSIEPTPEVFRFTLALAEAMSGYFSNEAQRVAKFLDVLQTRAEFYLHGTAILNNTTDLTLRKGPYIILNLEGKKESGTSSSDTSIQNTAYYSKHIATDLTVSQNCRMPVFLLSLRG